MLPTFALLLTLIVTTTALAEDAPQAQPTSQPAGDQKIKEEQREKVLVTATTIEPTVDLRNSEVFDRTLFTRDDQVFQQLNAGINAGQHEGGGKSLEIRRFGFNMDHGGVNGGLKVMLDGVQQNQGTQGHGQGYLGAMNRSVRS